MGRRGGMSRGARSRSSSPSKNLPSRTRQQTAPVPAAPAGPGLMGQMAATAGGVAIGSAIGHTVGHAITGAFSGGSSQQEMVERSQPEQVCGEEMKRFMECAQNYSEDISLCQGFADLHKKCRASYNL